MCIHVTVWASCSPTVTLPSLLCISGALGCLRIFCALQLKLRETIQQAEVKGELWTRNWDTFPLPFAAQDTSSAALAPKQPSQGPVLPTIPSANRAAQQWAPVPPAASAAVSSSTRSRSSDSDSDYSQAAGRLSYRRRRRSRSRTCSPTRSISRDP